MSETLYNAYVKEAFREEAQRTKSEVNKKIDDLVKTFKEGLNERVKAFGAEDFNAEFSKKVAAQRSDVEAVRAQLAEIERITQRMQTSATGFNEDLKGLLQQTADAKARVEHIYETTDQLVGLGVNAVAQSAKKLLFGIF